MNNLVSTNFDLKYSIFCETTNRGLNKIKIIIKVYRKFLAKEFLIKKKKKLYLK